MEAFLLFFYNHLLPTAGEKFFKDTTQDQEIVVASRLLVWPVHPIAESECPYLSTIGDHDLGLGCPYMIVRLTAAGVCIHALW